MDRIGGYKKYPGGPKVQVFALITPAGRRVRMTISERAPNTITAIFLDANTTTAAVRDQTKVHRHTVPMPEQHRDTIPTLYALSRQPGTAARFVSETVMILFDIKREGFGYRWDMAAPARSHWGHVSGERR